LKKINIDLAAQHLAHSLVSMYSLLHPLIISKKNI